MSSMYKQSDLILRLSDPLMRQGHYLWTNKTMECCMQHGIWNLFIQFCPKITKRKTSRMQNARLKVFCRAHQICPYSFGCHKKILSSLGGSSSTTTCGCCSSKYPRIRPDGLHWWQRKNFRMQWLNDFRKLVYHKSIWILNHWQQKNRTFKGRNSRQRCYQRIPNPNFRIKPRWWNVQRQVVGTTVGIIRPFLRNECNTK